jgi:hypothetical protein
LFLPGLYRETAWTIPQNQGQDLVTLVLAVPALGLALGGAGRGSARASLILVGLLGYICYTYAGAAYAYNFNPFFLIYVALFSLSVFALGGLVSNLDRSALRAQFDSMAPRRGVAGFLVVIALLLSVLWLGQIVPFLTQGILPELIVKADTPTNFVFVQDLGFVVPLAVLAAWELWRDGSWGYLLAGVILIKATAMGLALLGMSAFAWQAGQLTDLGLAVVWVGLAASSLSMTGWFLRHCRG